MPADPIDKDDPNAFGASSDFAKGQPVGRYAGGAHRGDRLGDRRRVELQRRPERDREVGEADADRVEARHRGDLGSPLNRAGTLDLGPDRRRREGRRACCGPGSRAGAAPTRDCRRVGG